MSLYPRKDGRIDREYLAEWDNARLEVCYGVLPPVLTVIVPRPDLRNHPRRSEIRAHQRQRRRGWYGSQENSAVGIGGHNHYASR